MSGAEEIATRRTLLLERTAVVIGETWARGWLAELGSEGRSAAGGWPGTITQALSRGRAMVTAELARARFQPAAADLTFSSGSHNDLLVAAKAAGQTLPDGLLISGSAIDDNDHLSRRDQGLEFLDVTSQITATVSTSGNTDIWTLANNGTPVAPNGATVIDTNLIVAVKGLPSGVTVDATTTTTNTARTGGTASGVTAGTPYYRLYLSETDAHGFGGVLNSGDSVTLAITRTGGGSNSSYSLQMLSGQGQP